MLGTSPVETVNSLFSRKKRASISNMGFETNTMFAEMIFYHFNLRFIRINFNINYCSHRKYPTPIAKLVFLKNMMNYKIPTTTWEQLEQRGFRKRDDSHKWTTEEITKMEKALTWREDNPGEELAKLDPDYYISFHIFNGKF